jgi:ABC-type uncharacterized transport system substrate-binding protein
MNRRAFIGLLGGATAWPLAARAQQEPMRRVGIMMSNERDSDQQARLVAFRRRLEELGWREGRNIRFEYRWPGDNPELVKAYAAELVAMAPDLILCGLTPGVQALKRETSSIPIVFANVADPVGSGLVPTLAKPGGNVTGFQALEYAIVGKWLGLLKEIAPNVERVALVASPGTVFSKNFARSLESIAPSFAVKPIELDVSTSADIEQAIDAFARVPNGGLLAVPAITASLHRNLIFTLAARHRLPAVYPFRYFAAEGGLASYGPDLVDQYRHVAGYVDRILRGAKAADLPVQVPVNYQLVINLKTAKALGFDIPPTLLARADEVIE